MKQGRWSPKATVVGLALIAAILAAATPAAAAPPIPVPDGYQDVRLVDSPENRAPMAVRFAPPPDGRIFVAQKSGVVLAYDGPHDPSPVEVIDLQAEVYDFYDRGMLGMAVDPGFAVNRRIYLLYSRDAPIGGTAPAHHDDCGSLYENGCLTSGKLVRITLDPVSGHAAQIQPVIEHQWCQQFPSHSIGTVVFGPDGMLYVGAGEGAMWWPEDYGQLGPPTNRCDDPADAGGSLRAQDVRTDGDPAGLDGAIIRVDPSTGAAAPGNPFAASADANKRRVIAYGMRNPFRFAFRPGTRDLWVGDVGRSAWEEINRVDTDDADAENLGWPCFEQADRLPVFDTKPLCSSLPQSAVTMPEFSYRHEQHLLPDDGCDPDSDTGSSIAGFAFDAAGVMYFTDFARNCIWSVQPDGDGEPDFSTTRVFARGEGGNGPVDLQIAPDGGLVYAYYDPFDPDESDVRMIRSSATNSAPVAEVTGAPLTGPTPLHVEFSAAGSTDADGDALAYAWDLDGDGAYDDGTGAEAARTYTTRDPVTVRVRVRDPRGEEDVAQVAVSPDNTAPEVRIDAPATGTTWAVDERIALDGSATDVDGDGVQLVWTLTLEHCDPGAGCHTHPMQQLTGPAAEFTTPDHEYPSYVRVRLTGTDPGGLSDTVTMDLHPRSVTVGVKTIPEGLEAAASASTVLEGSAVVLSTSTPQLLGAARLDFMGWLDGGTDPVRTVRVHEDSVFTARFAVRAGPTPPGSPPPPPPPPPLDLSDRIAPRLHAAHARLRGRRLSARVTCPAEACRVVAHARGRTATRHLHAGRAVTVVVRLSRRAAAGRRVALRLVATDAAGNRTTVRRTVRAPA